jgi:hypothetical protein
MNIVYLIGNGFDLNLGMKTSYKDFYDYYCMEKSSNENIEKLKNEIKNNIENWSDLELALGKHTEKVNTSIEFEEIRENIINKLSIYLEQQENLFDIDSINIEKLALYLSSPQRSLLKSDENKIDEFLTLFQNEKAKIDIITFNYTSVLESLLSQKLKQPVSYTNAINQYTEIHDIEHIHGTLDERMIIGVNDITQISNIKFEDNIDFIESFIKPEYNKAAKHTIDYKCIDLISKANIICIYGSSIGESDIFWWQLIGNRIKVNDCILIIFEKCFDINSKLFANKISQKERFIREKFLKQTNLNKEEKMVIEKNIFVGINTDFLNIKNK